ncbi:unnamed protein product [Acanthoscelides obtectus]|uniref:Uncharacterized protein n=1 Tax=Acanthoscelides obtectus TaxID=200917 RepID=A0A9P0L5I0_ACAOB|nr:unnamed protein product [Acanthoscelides obtectus]CAK1662461.1 hypothetical protein AOBTE_LOCUS23152 [Acanthoscelides obtectus]
MLGDFKNNVYFKINQWRIINVCHNRQVFIYGIWKQQARKSDLYIVITLVLPH